MRLLVLGGTWFLGRALVEQARDRGHQVTTFNRGRSGHDVVGVESVRGDRERRADLERLVRHRSWDAAIDTSGYVPRIVGGAADLLAKAAGLYVFVSTVSVYQGWPIEPLTEESAVLECPSDAGSSFGEDGPRGYPTQYGFLKAGCERAVSQFFEGRELILRPGVILGIGEYVGRLPWWLRRTARGGRVVAPGAPGRTIQPIDARDVADFALDGVESTLTGTFNVTAPKDHSTFGGMLRDCINVTGSGAELVWLPNEFLLRHGVKQWTELPLWRTHAGTWDVAAVRARAAGLRCRPLADTVRDTWAWLQDEDQHRRAEEQEPGGQGADAEKSREAEHGLTEAKERALLREWDEQH